MTDIYVSLAVKRVKKEIDTRNACMKLWGCKNCLQKISDFVCYGIFTEVLSSRFFSLSYRFNLIRKFEIVYYIDQPEPDHATN